MAKKKKGTGLTIGEITSQFERKLNANQNVIERTAVDLFTSAINQLVGIAALQKLPNGVFSLSKLPTLNNSIDELLGQLTKNLEVVVKNGIEDAWQLSNDKNNIFADIRLDGSLIPANKKLIFYDANKPALEAFEERVVNGLNLSDRIYEAGQVFKGELEAGIGLGISEGQSAAEMGRSLKQYLKEPEKLFRRVRDSEGNLQLSKRAKAYKPGQGVYRSSTKNIKRLTRTETNTAYRSADNARWQNTPFILGQTIQTSGNHPKLDVCDDLKGDYPVEFKFIGWHPQCLCFATTVLMNDDQFIEYQKLVLAGTDTPENVAKIAPRVENIPEGASTWMDENKARIAGYQQPPLWWQQNPDFVPDLPKA